MIKTSARAVSFFTLLAVLLVACSGQGGETTNEGSPASTDAQQTSPDPGGEDGQEPATGEAQSIRVAMTPGFATLPIHVAQERGIFEEHGLDVQATEGIELATWLPALGNQYDIALSVPGIFLDGAQQFDVVAVAGVELTRQAGPGNQVLVTDDDSIQGPGDLEGKRVGVGTLTGTQAQGLRYLVEQAGGNYENVEFVQMGFGEQLDQLNAGNVDAVGSAIPFYTQLEAEGYRVVFDIMAELAEAATGADESASAFFISTSDYATENSEVLSSFRDAYQEALDWVTSNEEEARDMLQEWLGLPEEIAMEAPLPAISVDITAEQLEPFAVLWDELDLSDELIDASELVWRPSE